jgi:NADH-quinone oxidoreductase subunit D
MAGVSEHRIVGVGAGAAGFPDEADRFGQLGYERGGSGAGSELFTEDMVLNVGPQHPATHGVLRLRLTLDGERIVRCEPIIG